MVAPPPKKRFFGLEFKSKHVQFNELRMTCCICIENLRNIQRELHRWAQQESNPTARQVSQKEIQ